MLFSYRRATLILTAAAVPAMACRKHETAPAVFETVAMAEGSDSTVYIEDEIWVELADQPREHLTAAREHIINRQWDAALTDLRKTSAFLRLEAKKSGRPDHDRLLQTAHELDHLATEVKQENLPDLMSMDQTLGRAYHTLAVHNRQRAESAWSADHRATAVAYLREAASETQRAFDEVGVAADSTAQQAIEYAKGLNLDASPATISDSLADLGIAIEYLETALSSGTAS